MYSQGCGAPTKSCNFCPNCGHYVNNCNFCPNCGHTIKDYIFSQNHTKASIPRRRFSPYIYPIIIFLLGIPCFIPRIYLSKNYYKIGSALAAAEYGDTYRLEKFRSFESTADILLVIGILFFVASISFFIYLICTSNSRKH